MNVYELMIGDWVYRVDFKEPIPDRILGLEVVNYDTHPMQYIADVFCPKHNNNVGLYMDTICPIPLTAEILEKNGFVKGEEVSDTPPYDQDEEGNMYYSFRGELKFWGWWQPDNTYYIPANAMGDIIIRYVHELQHALRLAGIEKTIEL